MPDGARWRWGKGEGEARVCQMEVGQEGSQSWDTTT